MRVCLSQHGSSRREYVVRVLMKVVDGLTVDDAVNVMQVQVCHMHFTYLEHALADHDLGQYCIGATACQVLQHFLQEAHQNGMACVIECAQEDAERYCEGLRGNGLMASVEPAGGGGDSRPSE